MFIRNNDRLLRDHYAVPVSHDQTVFLFLFVMRIKVEKTVNSWIYVVICNVGNVIVDQAAMAISAVYLLFIRCKHPL